MKFIAGVVGVLSVMVGGEHAARADGGETTIILPEETPSGIPYKIYDKASWPRAYARRTLTLPAGMLEVGGELAVLIPSDNEDGIDVSNVVSVTPRIYYGVAPLVTLGFSQSTGLAIVPDLSDPMVIDAETIEAEPLNLLAEGIFKVFGGYDIALRTGLQVNNGLTETYDPVLMIPTSDEITIISLRGAFEGRVAFAANKANLRFRAGVAIVDVGGEDTTPVADLELQLLYQTTREFMIGVRTGLMPRDWQLGTNDDDFQLVLQLMGLYNVVRELDITFRGGFVDDELLSGIQLGVGLSYRPAI